MTSDFEDSVVKYKVDDHPVELLDHRAELLKDAINQTWSAVFADPYPSNPKIIKLLQLASYVLSMIRKRQDGVLIALMRSQEHQRR
jgi:hypothetical protein